MYGLTPYEKNNNNYSIFDAFHDFEKDFFGGKLPTAACKTDIKEENDKYFVETELPGVEKEDINIDINGNYLTISAEHSVENDDTDKTKSGKYIHRERNYGSYRRSFDISEVNTDKIEAEYKNGVLIMTLPKKAEDTPAARRLEIK